MTQGHALKGQAWDRGVGQLAHPSRDAIPDTIHLDYRGGYAAFFIEHY